MAKQSSNSRMEARRKRARAIELADRGYTYDEIAEEVGYKDRSGAYRAVQTAIAEQVREPAEHVRRAELRRMDLALKAAFEVLETPHYVVNSGKIVHRIVEYLRDDSGGILLDSDGNPMAEKLEILYDDAPKLQAIDRILKIMARRAKLLGLDAPAKYEAVHPDVLREETSRLATELGLSADEMAELDRAAADLINQYTDQGELPE